MREFSESLNISDDVRFITYKDGVVYFSVNGEKTYKEFDKLSFFMKKFITKGLLKV